MLTFGRTRGQSPRGLVVAVVRRPELWATAVRQLLVLARPGWWRRPPRLPMPDRDYIGFRMQTMYGKADQAPEPADVVAYLKWCRGYRRGLG